MVSIEGSNDMHKFFLTESECEVIQGSHVVTDCIGGFPSMENGSIANIKICQKDNLARYIIKISFDIR